jgi:hypothetical protein
MQAPRRPVFEGIVAVVVVLVLVGIWRTWVLVEGMKPSVLANRPECPHDWSEVDTSTFTPVALGQFSLPQEYTNVPEYHDCQKLVVGPPRSRTFSALAAIFLSADIIKGTIPLGGSAQLVGGTLHIGSFAPRLVVTDDRTSIPLGGFQPAQQSPTDTYLGTPYVEAVSEADYDYLGIRKGFNCLYLKWQNTAATVVTFTRTSATATASGASTPATTAPSTGTARTPPAAVSAAAVGASGSPLAPIAATMVSFGDEEQDCRNPSFNEETHFQALKVVRVATDPRPGSVPLVTRWGWDEAKGIHLIGIPCSTSSWCEVGPTTELLTGSPSYSIVGEGPERTIQGWYDEQFLASESEDGLVPSAIRGTVFPVRGLDTLKLAYYAASDASTFRNVAYVAVSARDDAKYFSRYLYDAAPASGAYTGMATIALCYGLADACKIPANTDPTDLKQRCVPTPQKPGIPAIEHPWWARITAPDGSEKYFCVAYRGHPSGFKMPSVVRWRWRADDETVWIPCPSACCEVDKF